MDWSTNNIDEKSEAVRDLRTFYAIPPFYDGAYLYGNILEDDSYIQNNIVFTYHNVDVNCDGDENDYITGLNTKSWYTNIDYACIISDWLGNGSDGVVTTYAKT